MNGSDERTNGSATLAWPALPGHRAERASLQAFVAAFCPDWRGPTLAIDVHGLCLLHANRRGREMLRRGYPARLLGGNLAISAPHATRRLDATLTALATGVSDTAMIVIDDEEQRTTYSVCIHLPATPPLLQPGRIAIFDFAIASRQPQPSELRAIGDAFELTAAESTVLGHLAAGYSLREIAHLRGVGLETVRHQCKKVLAKMRCRRQADLVRMVTALCSRDAIGLMG